MRLIKGIFVSLYRCKNNFLSSVTPPHNSRVCIDVSLTSAWQAAAYLGKDAVITSGIYLSALSIRDNKEDQETLSEADLY